MKQIVCNLNLFDMVQKVMVVDMDTGEAKLLTTGGYEELGTIIAKGCQHAETYYVHLYGEEDVINEIIIPQIEEYLGRSYGLDELEIEVN